eukprot:319857-Chlamydomonas_euryale.AAC.2
MNGLEPRARPELGTRQAGLRLRRLQAAVAAAKLDGLLLVSGQDGKYNVGSAQAVAYLLQGASNREAAEAVHLADDLSDAVVLVTPAGLAAYMPRAETAAQVYELLGETAPGMQVWVPTREEVADPDLAEEAKLGAFVQMLRGKFALGMPWVVPPVGGEEKGLKAFFSKPPSPMELEQWPLLNAYGLEGVGRAGFFTQNFKVWTCNHSKRSTAH